MTYFTEALSMLFSLDKELYGIILLTLKISAMSLIISSFIGVSLSAQFRRLPK